MSHETDKLICESLLEIKTLIEECKGAILGSIEESADDSTPLPDDVHLIVEELLEANFIYDELIRQLLH